MGRAVAALLIFSLTNTLNAQQAATALAGFTTQSAPDEASWEQRFK